MPTAVVSKIFADGLNAFFSEVASQQMDVFRTAVIITKKPNNS